MERQRYCVYNQTNECFLSLRAILDDGTPGVLRAIFRRNIFRADEGCWIIPSKAFQSMVIFASHDLIYLDERQRVVQVVESFHPFRTAPPAIDVASMLVLPVHTIDSSQTRNGNQLLICPAEEMESRLRDLPQAFVDEPAPTPGNWNAPPPDSGMPRAVARERRNSLAKRRRCRAGYRMENGFSDAYAIRDVSPTGLYVVTRERWPLGAQLKLKLQPTLGFEENARAISVAMRVSRWGNDGVGLDFIAPNLNQTAMIAMQAQSTDRACDISLELSNADVFHGEEVTTK